MVSVILELFLSMPLCVSSLMGDSLVVDKVYRLCVVPVRDFDN